MLEFWYSQRCTRQIKLFLCVVSFVLVYWSSSITKITTGFACASLLLGLSLHIAYQLGRKTIMLEQRNLFGLFCSSIFVFILAGLIWMLPENNKAITSLQVIGYSMLGFFVISIYALRSRRHD